LKNNYSKLILDYFKAFLSKGVGVIYGLILLKLLAIYLSDEDFSNYFIFYNISFYCYTVFFTIQSSAILRYFHIKGENGIVHFVNIINTVSILINLLFFGIIFFYNVIDTFSLFALFVLIQSLGFFNNEINYLRIKHSFDRVLYLLIIQALLAITGILLFKEILDFRRVLMIIAISFLIPVFLFKSKKNLLLFKKIKFNIIKDNLDVVKYSLPIVFIALANSTMSSIDQIILKYYNFHEGLSAYIANYTVAEKSVVFLLSIITLVFVPTVFKKYNKLTINVFKDIYNVVIVFVLISLFLLLILFNFSDLLTVTLTNKDFLNYSWAIPYIAFGGIFLGINSIVSEVFTVAKKSIILMYSYVLGMIANLILNITFIPIYGITGAVFTTIGTYIIMLMITLSLAYKLYIKIKIDEI